MPIEFLGIAATNDGSETVARSGASFDKDYTLRLARAHEDNGWDRVLFAYGSGAPDPAAAAAYIAGHTDTIQLLLAHRPNLSIPTYAAKTFATIDQISEGRVTVHFITGGNDHEQAREGDRLSKDDRYSRTREYIEIVKRVWTEHEPFDHAGRHYAFEDFVSDVFPVRRPRPDVSFGGSSPAAYETGAAVADIYCLWGEPLADTAEQIETIRNLSRAAGRDTPPRIQVAFRPILGATEAAAWEKAHDVVERIERRTASGTSPLARRGRGTPQNTGSQRLLRIADAGDRYDRAMWTATAKATGGAGNSNALVGTPETVAAALLDYVDLGVDILSARGYDLLDDAVEFGQQVIPIVREEVAKRDPRAVGCIVTAVRPVHLNLFVAGHGYHEASWRVSESSGGPLGLDHFVGIAQLAERGVLDSIFFADAPGVAPFRTRFMAQAGYDPIDLLAALSAVTAHVGLLATASTTYGTPWDVARRFATLDHLSGGRAGWNIVTTGTPVAAANFGAHPHAAHDDRYRRAQEFVEVVQAVWDGWDDDAVVAEADGGWWADPAKLHPPDHHGEHYDVAGILGFPRSPQGHPLLVQAGSSPQGVDLAARFADLVFTPQSTIEDTVAFRRHLQDQAAGYGRRPDDVRTLPGLSFVLGGTEAEAARGWRQLQEASHPTFRLFNLANLAGVDPAEVEDLDPDGPFPYELFERAASVTFARTVMRTARQDELTFRQTAERFATLPGGLHLTGTPEQLADLIETWWRAGAADGFTLQPLRLPRDAAAFVDHVVPILHARGVAAPEYGAGTLRDRLGLPRPSDHGGRHRPA